ncbi:hypothetical protein [Bdellovibrio bacteriovorus]|uniref:hypothetical protein n=1 Tax=Bdellovibrio bacteriovorus TaxID=959 RepID=UPI0035A69C21
MNFNKLHLLVVIFTVHSVTGLAQASNSVAKVSADDHALEALVYETQNLLGSSSEEDKWKIKILSNKMAHDLARGQSNCAPELQKFADAGSALITEQNRQIRAMAKKQFKEAYDESRLDAEYKLLELKSMSYFYKAINCKSSKYDWNQE